MRCFTFVKLFAQHAIGFDRILPNPPPVDGARGPKSRGGGQSDKRLRTATVAPGYIPTPGVAALEADGRVDSTQIRRWIPMGDLGRPEDIADAVHFVASPGASYVNGTLLNVDGGWNAFGSAGNASDAE